VAAEPPIRAFRTRAAWEKWLDAHSGDEAGIWVKFAKKGTGVTTVAYAEALEVALCFGWIDAQVKSRDEVYYLQRFTPRRARSRWSKINRDAATRLIEAGKMKPPGLREVERAQADGRWDAAYDSPRTAEVPEDLERALRRNKRARESFAALTPGRRYTILYAIQEAKRAETRARRIATFVEKLARGEKIE
jgi:uncharacterized protein YdeI (YjbR/CyaY-like superfamily)